MKVISEEREREGMRKHVMIFSPRNILGTQICGPAKVEGVRLSPVPIETVAQYCTVLTTAIPKADFLTRYLLLQSKELEE